MNVKNCPECGVEYFAHVNQCADCGVELMTPEELQNRRMKAVPLNEGAGDLVAVREGEKEWIEELHATLEAASVSSRIDLSPGCRAGTCGSTYVLLVRMADATDALTRIETYYREVHPEMGEADDLAAAGKCPACGHAVGAEAMECRECGLVLMISESGEP